MLAYYGLHLFELLGSYLYHFACCTMPLQQFTNHSGKLT